MRVLFVSNVADLYGAGRALLRVVEALGDAIQPSVLLPEEGPLAERLRATGARVIIRPGMTVLSRRMFRPWGLVRLPFLFLRAIAADLRLLWSYRPDVVHTNTSTLPSMAVATRIARVPHVWHNREIYDLAPGLWKVYQRYMALFADVVVANSTATAAQHRWLGGARLELLPDGFSQDELEIGLQDAMGSGASAQGEGEATPSVGLLGRIKLGEKGQEVLVEAARLLRHRHPGARYLIIGEAFPGNEEHEKELRALIRKGRLEEQVRLLGHHDDVRPLLRSLDIVVNCSTITESFGSVVAEAMAFGKPVVAPNRGGPVDQVVDGETGYLVEPGDPRALAGALDRLLGDAELRERLGRSGRRRVLERFDIRQLSDRLLEIYTSLCDERNGRGKR